MASDPASVSASSSSVSSSSSSSSSQESIPPTVPADPFAFEGSLSASALASSQEKGSRGRGRGRGGRNSRSLLSARIEEKYDGDEEDGKDNVNVRRSGRVRSRASMEELEDSMDEALDDAEVFSGRGSQLAQRSSVLPPNNPFALPPLASQSSIPSSSQPAFSQPLQVPVVPSPPASAVPSHVQPVPAQPVPPVPALPAIIPSSAFEDRLSSVVAKLAESTASIAALVLQNQSSSAARSDDADPRRYILIDKEESKNYLSSSLDSYSAQLHPSIQHIIAGRIEEKASWAPEILNQRRADGKPITPGVYPAPIPFGLDLLNKTPSRAHSARFPNGVVDGAGPHGSNPVNCVVI